MTPEQLYEKLMGRKRFPIMHDEFQKIMLNTIRAAYTIAYEESAKIAEACTCAGSNDIWPAAQRAIAEDIRARSVALLSQERSPKTPNQGA